MAGDGPRVELAERAARRGAEVATARFREAVAVESKGHKNDLVTAADAAAQEAVVETIEEERPGESIVGEENHRAGAVPETGPSWIVDPIDGTTNYARGMRMWATSVAAMVDGRPVAAATVQPAMGDAFVADETGVRRNGDPVAVSDSNDPETFLAAVNGWHPAADNRPYTDLIESAVDRFADVRRFGSMQSSLAAVAAGSLDAHLTKRTPEPWDSVAGAYMVEQAGGTVTDIDGNPWRYDSEGLVASNGRAHETVLAAVRATR
ncbi:hypothetical protein BRC83_00035 [Halobacteriales archaeon QS_1_68_17]|nr:MAG: hypothetical protein BRC83_00035 [Halobacteriales archaeon QS_1_68_17]